MAWVSDIKNEGLGYSGADTGTVQLASTAAGSNAFLGISVWASPAAPTSVTVSDGTNGSYSTGFYIANVVQAVGLYYFENSAGGTITITANPNINADFTLFGHSFTGGAASSSLSGTPNTNTGTSTAPSSGSMTPANNDVLAIAISGVDGFQDTYARNQTGSSPTDWVLSNDALTATQPGSMVYKIFSGSAGSPVHVWEASTGGAKEWAAGIAAFKISAAAVLINASAGSITLSDATAPSTQIYQVAVVVQDETDGTWLPSTGSDLYATLDDDSDADYDYVTGNSTMEVKFGALNDPDSSSGHTLHYRIKGTGSNTITVYLIQGPTSTVIATYAHANAPATLTSYEQTLSAEEANSITDYTDLRLRVTTS